MQMVATDPLLLPLVDLRPVANRAHQWVALSARFTPGTDDSHPDGWAGCDIEALLTAIAPLDCVLHVQPADMPRGALLARLPASRIVLAVEAASLDQPDTVDHLRSLQARGYRIVVDGAAQAAHLLPTSPPTLPPTLQAIAHDFAILPGPVGLSPLVGPHLAYGVDTTAQFSAACQAGFAWFSGTHVLHAARADGAPNDGGITARRLLKLLGLLLADAETRDIEVELKQDPVLAFQLMKLANSAAFAPAKPIHHFAQAIDLLGRRQLLRWLQLLMYARPRADGSANPLLPIAALRAAQVESLCKQHGCVQDQQDLAFQVGVFSLLDILLDMPMRDIVESLRLPAEPAGALLRRSGTMGALLALVESAAPARPALAAVQVTPAQWWASQLDGFHWAIQVSRNL